MIEAEEKVGENMKKMSREKEPTKKNKEKAKK